MKIKKAGKLSVIFVVLAVVLFCSIFAVISKNENGNTKNKNNSTSSGVVNYAELNYIAFGDSVTYGWDVSIMARMDNPYPNLVADELGLNSVINYAVSGSTITYIDGLTNINSQYKNASSKADIVSVMIGVNDYARSANLGTINDKGLTTVYGGLNVLVDGLKSKYPNSFIFFMTPFQCYSNSIITNAVGVQLSEVVVAIKNVCTANDIPYLDLYTCGQYTMALDPYSDGLHPTQQFFVNYTAPQIAQFIKDNYKA